MKALITLIAAIGFIGCGGGNGYYGGPPLGDAIGSSWGQNFAPMMQPPPVQRVMVVPRNPSMAPYLQNVLPY